MALELLSLFALLTRSLTVGLLAVVIYLYAKMLQKVRQYVPEIELKKVFLDQINISWFISD